MDTPSDPAATSWLDGLAVLATLLLAGLLGTAVIRNADIWQHLAAGRLISAGELRFGDDPFSFTTAGQTWVNHAWGFDVGVYQVWQVAGPAGVVLARGAVVLVLAAALMGVRRPGAGLALPAFGAALALVAANARLPFFQPATVSYALTAVLVCLLTAAPRWRTPWLGPLAFFLLHAHWVNHDGWFWLGPVILLAYAAGQSAAGGDGSGRSNGWWALCLLAAVAGGLANPFHVAAYGLPDELAPSFFDQSIQYDSAFASYVFSPLEGVYPARVGAAAAWTLYFLLPIGLISFALNIAGRPWGRLAVWAILAALACWRARLVPFFAVGGTPLVVLNIQDVLARTPMTPNRQQLSVFARVAAALAIFGLAVAAWPGWLGPRANDPARAARVGLRIETDPGLVAAIAELAGRKDVQRCFCVAPESATLLAWHGPGLKSYVDTRWRLHAPRAADFVRARAPLVALEAGKSADSAPADRLFKQEQIQSLVLIANERGGGAAARAFFTVPDLYPLQALAGRVTAFRTRPGPVGVDPAALAFAPQAAVPLKPLPDDDLRVPNEWERFAFGPPARPPQYDESSLWLEYSDAVDQRATAAMQMAQTVGLIGAAAGLAPVAPRFPANLLVSGRVPPPPERFAAGVLAVRRARVGRSVQPDDPESAYRFILAMQKFASLESLSSVQYSAALHQARVRLPIAAAWGRDESGLAFAIADLSSRWFLSRQQFDSALADAKEALRLMQAPEVAGRFDSGTWEQAVAGRRKQIEQLENEVAARRERFEQQAVNQPLMARLFLAERFGLPAVALAELEAAASNPEQIKNVDLLPAIELMIRVGQAEEARRLLRSPNFEPITAVDPARRPAVRRLKLAAAIGCGDDARAEEEIQALAEDARAAELDARKYATTVIATLMVGGDVAAAPALTRAVTSPAWLSGPAAARAVGDKSAERFELLSWRGLLALQVGDTRVARRAFAEALTLPPAIGRDVVDLYVKFLSREE